MRVLNILILINTYVTEKKTYWMSKTFGDYETSISFYFYCQNLFIQILQRVLKRTLRTLWIMPSMLSSTYLSFFVESLDKIFFEFNLDILKKWHLWFFFKFTIHVPMYFIATHAWQWIAHMYDDVCMYMALMFGNRFEATTQTNWETPIPMYLSSIQIRCIWGLWSKYCPLPGRH